AAASAVRRGLRLDRLRALHATHPGWRGQPRWPLVRQRKDRVRHSFRVYRRRRHMSDLDALENQSIYILREAFSRLKPIAMLWSLGKDSNVMLWLARKAFLGHVPFPVVHVDTGKKFREMYEFRDSFSKTWNLNLIVRDCPPVEEIDPSLPPAARSAARKTVGLRRVLDEFKFKGIIAGIRRDIAREQIPIVDLYYAKNGKRYRSLGDQDITSPIASNAANLNEIIAELSQTKTSERAGRAMDHEREDAFERLRAQGYM